MIGVGPWLDLGVALLLALTVALLYRLATTDAAFVSLPDAGADADVEDETPANSGRWRALAGYYPRLARQAGYDPGALEWTYWLAKLGLAVLVPLLVLVAWSRWSAGTPWLLLPVLIPAGFFLPDLALLWARRTRRLRIRRALSFFLDLMVSLLRSGLGLEEAFRRAGRGGLDQDHPLAREVALVDLELAAGKSRGVAFEALAERTGVRELKSLAAALRLGLRVGSSVRATLEAQADLMRTKRREETRRQLALAPLKTLLPVILCGFPVFIVFVLFPAVVEIFSVLGELATLF